MKAKLLIASTLFLSCFITKAQYCTSDTRYSDAAVFTDAQIKTDLNIPYGTAVDWQGQTQTLTLNAYYPKPAVDPSPKRPFILIIHGGSFLSGDKSDYNFECKEFAKRGFVTATINYRLGWDCANDLLSYDKAVYRANQDAKAALRFAVANATSLKIDTAWMFIGGGSAGSGTAMGVVYLSQADWNVYRPTLQSVLGDLNTSGNTLTDTYSLKGIYNLWGGVARDFMSVNEMLPTISFHGGSDPTVDVDSALSGSCTNPLMVYGSRSIHRELTEAGVCSDLSVVLAAGHGVYNNSPEQKLFRIQKAACFFKSVFCNNCISVSTTDTVPANCSGITGINKQNKDSEPTIYPNPTKNSVSINGLNDQEDFKIMVSNILGQQKFSVTNKDFIDISSLPAGIYIFQLQQGLKSYSIKVVKEY